MAQLVAELLKAAAAGDQAGQAKILAQILGSISGTLASMNFFLFVIVVLGLGNMAVTYYKIDKARKELRQLKRLIGGKLPTSVQLPPLPPR